MRGLHVLLKRQLSETQTKGIVGDDWHFKQSFSFDSWKTMKGGNSIDRHYFLRQTKQNLQKMFCNSIRVKLIGQVQEPSLR